jgi:hypothetical protein
MYWCNTTFLLVGRGRTSHNVQFLLGFISRSILLRNLLVNIISSAVTSNFNFFLLLEYTFFMLMCFFVCLRKKQQI